MAYQDVYELVDVSTLSGQEVLNVYFFFNNNTLGASANASDLVDSYVGQLLPAVLEIQTDNVLHTEIRCRNLFDASDRVTVGISEVGVINAQDTLGNANAVGFALSQDNGEVGNGAKRYGGIGETNTTDGIITLSGYITTLLELGELLASILDFGIIPTFLPIIVKRILDGATYRLPENSGELVYGSITDAVYNPVVTTQTSRKIGYGV